MLTKSLVKKLSDLKVVQKIGLGYVLAVGVGVSGTAAGTGIGNYFEYRAEVQEEAAHAEVELLKRLHSRMLQTQTHQQQLLHFLNKNPEEFAEEYEQLRQYKGEVQAIWKQLKQFVAQSPQLLTQNHQSHLLTLIQTYDHVPQRYTQQLEKQLEQIDRLDLTSVDGKEQAQAILNTMSQDSILMELDDLADDLLHVTDEAYVRLEDIYQLQREVNILVEIIVVTSFVLSIVIGVLLVVLISHVIAKPIQALTEVAQRTTQESNFELRARADHRDEIGQLAQAFNQLTDSVQQLLQQQQITKQKLEDYSQSLENEVGEKNRLLEELQRTQAQMVQSEKMSALGQMVAGIAHEINNPVSFIHGNLTYAQEYTNSLMAILELYEKQCPEPDPIIQAKARELEIEFIREDLLQVLDSMKLGTDRICKIILSLRNFSRLDEAEVKVVDIHEGIDSTLLILQHRFKDTPEHPAIQIVRDYGDVPLVECYPSQLNQVFMNILANAIDALEEGNTERTYQEIQRNPNQITIRTSTQDLNWVRIEIADNGIGMSESVRQRIFDPFFTTKEVGKGTGMGIPISYQIVANKHGGKLDCFSKVGEGTKFMVQIPVRQTE